VFVILTAQMVLIIVSVELIIFIAILILIAFLKLKQMDNVCQIVLKMDQIVFVEGIMQNVVHNNNVNL